MGEPVLLTHTASDGYCWKYRQYDPPAAPRARVVCVHGIQSHGGWYEHSCRELAAAGFAVSFLDRRGSGLNDRDRGDAPSFRRLLDDIAEYLASLTTHHPPLPTHLLAISWGGKLAVALQRRYPGLVNGLALLCPGFRARVRPSFRERLGIVWSYFTAPQKLFPVPLNDPDLFTASPEWQQFLRDDPLAVRQATARLLGHSARLDGYLRFVPGHVTVPVLLLLAGQDRIIDNAGTRRFVDSFAARDKTIIEYPEAHHTLEFEPRPHRYLDDLIGWLRQRTPSAAPQEADESPMNHPLIHLFLSRLRQHYREPHALFWVYGFPLILTVALGIAFSSGHKPDPIKVDIIGDPDSSAAQKLHARLKAPQFDAQILPEAQARQRLRTDKTSLIVVPTADDYRYIFDPANPNSLAAHAAVDDVLVRWKAGVVVQWQEAADGEVTTQYTVGGDASRTLRTTDSTVSEPGSRYIDFLIPGIMGINIMGGGLFGVGFLLVDMRVRKLLKRLLATLKRGHFLLSILGTRLILLVPEMTLLLLVARLGFGFRVFGNPLIVALIVLLGAVAFAGIGLVLASRTDKMETISGLTNLVALPGWLLSGTLFSADRFPAAVQPVIQALPLTQLNEALRAVMLEGKSLTDQGVAWRVLALAAWGGVSFLLAMKWFRWQ